MCGLFGMMGPGITTRDQEIFLQLGEVSQLRGRDGAGIYHVSSSRNHYEKLYKTTNTFSWLVKNLKFGTRTARMGGLMSSCQPDIYLGHVRWTTSGEESDSNSHPFQFDKIVGAHNGTLRDHKYYDFKIVDSYLMFKDMNERGIEPVLKGLDDDSAYAITVYNREEGVMYFARNKKRPLYAAFLESRSVMYWASELDTLQYILKRNGEEAKYATFTPDIIYKVDPWNISLHTAKKEGKEYLDQIEFVTRVKPKIEPVKKEEPKKPEPDPVTIKEEEKKEEVNSNNVVPFRKHGQFHDTCLCGKRHINSYMERSQIHRGKHGEIYYDKSVSRYICLECDGNVQSG